MFSSKDKKQFIDGWVRSKKIKSANRNKVSSYLTELPIWDTIMEVYSTEKKMPPNTTGETLWMTMNNDKTTKVSYPQLKGAKNAKKLVNTVLASYLKKQPSKLSVGLFLNEVVRDKNPLKLKLPEPTDNFDDHRKYLRNKILKELVDKTVGKNKISKEMSKNLSDISSRIANGVIDSPNYKPPTTDEGREAELDKIYKSDLSTFINSLKRSSVSSKEVKSDITDRNNQREEVQGFLDGVMKKANQKAEVQKFVDGVLKGVTDKSEVHLQTPSRSYNFVGAGTNLKKRMAGEPPSKTIFGKGTPPYGVPVDELDWEALKHDMFYISDSPLVRRYADSEFVEELSRMKGVTPAVSKQLINLKVLTESKLPKSRNELQGMMNKKERAHLKMTEDMFKSYTNFLVARGYRLDPETRDTIKGEPLQNIDDFEKSFKEFEREIYKLKEATDENEIKEIIQDEADLPQMPLLDPLVESEVKEEVKSEVKEDPPVEKKVLAVQPEIITPTSLNTSTNVEQELLSQLTQAGSTDVKQTPEEDKTNDEVIMKEFVLKEPEFVDRNNKLKIEEQRNKSIQYLGPMFNQELATDIIHTKKIALQKEPVPPTPELKRQFSYEPMPQTISMKSNYKPSPFKPAHAASNFYSQQVFHARGLIPDEPDNFILF